MQVEKKSFVLYNDQSKIIQKLSDKQAGVLIKKIYSYVNNGIYEMDEDAIVDIVYTVLTEQINRDIEKYCDKIEKASNSGMIGNLKRWPP